MNRQPQRFAICLKGELAYFDFVVSFFDLGFDVTKIGNLRCGIQ